MDESFKDIKPKQERNSKTKELEHRVSELENQLAKLTEAIRQSAHVMGWPPDLLVRHGFKPFDKKKEKLQVNGR